jgi:hypothetical protein
MPRRVASRPCSRCNVGTALISTEGLRHHQRLVLLAEVAATLIVGTALISTEGLRLFGNIAPESGVDGVGTALINTEGLRRRRGRRTGVPGSASVGTALISTEGFISPAGATA